MAEQDKQQRQPRSESTKKQQVSAHPPAQGMSCGTATTLLLIIILVGGGALVSFAFFGWNRAKPAETPPPQPTIHSRVAVVRQINQLSRLETVQYTLRDVVRVEKEGGILGIGSQKNLLIIYGTATAGIDLGLISEEDILIAGDGMSITIHLPPAEIFTYNLDHSKTELYDSSTGLFTSADPELILDALKEGEVRVLRAAYDDGVMERATRYGELSMARFLDLLGFEQVTVVAAPVPEYPLPTPTPTTSPTTPVLPTTTQPTTPLLASPTTPISPTTAQPTLPAGE